MSIKKKCPRCGASADARYEALCYDANVICGNCGESSAWGDWKPGERPISYEEALRAIQNNWPDSGFSRLRTALNELQRLAAIGYAEETRPEYPAGYGPDMRPLTKEKALELLRDLLGSTKADRMLKMFLDAHDVFEDKNGDYGDAFSYTLKKHGDVAALTRVTDKFLRIETLLTGRKAAVKDETVEDTILDLGNYCFMWKMERQLLKEAENDSPCRDTEA